MLKTTMNQWMALAASVEAWSGPVAERQDMVLVGIVFGATAGYSYALMGLLTAGEMPMRGKFKASF